MAPHEALLALNAFLSDQRRNLSALGVDIANESVKRKRLEQEVGVSGPAIVANAPAIRRRAEAIAAIDKELATLREVYTDRNPKVIGKLEDRNALVKELEDFLSSKGVAGLNVNNTDDDSAILEETGRDEETQARIRKRLQELADEEEPSYRMNAGDEIEIRVYGHEDIGMTTKISPDGTVGIAFLGQIRLSGKTISEGAEHISKGLAPFVKHPVVSITVKEISSESATIVGACAKPVPGPAAAESGNPMASGVRMSGATKIITLPGGAKMEMIWCEPGTFMMGSPLAERGRFDDEPLHPVTLTKGFWLGKYEVTQGQWQSVMGHNPSKFKDPDRPVESVSWEDCSLFISRLNTELGGVARFPTEAEWEYACRAGSSNPVSGNGLLSDMAWYDANSGNETHPVGKNHANAWGFYDMHGNVLEWCYDWFGNFEAKATDPRGPASGSFRVLRGGCWFFYARDCRSAYRLKRDPVLRNAIFGFRLACSDK